MSFVENIGKSIGKNISKSLSNNYSQKSLGHIKQPGTDARETVSKQAVQKITEPTGDLISNKIADKNAKISKASPQNNSETVINEHHKIYLNKIYISREERQKIIDDLKLMT